MGERWAITLAITDYSAPRLAVSLAGAKLANMPGCRALGLIERCLQAKSVSSFVQQIALAQ